jgi:SAM-dependent methyltransferase
MSIDDDWLTTLRVHEAELVLARAPHPFGRVLELGGGSGQQAAVFARHGAQVRSIDTQAAHGAFPVEPYDGRHIPFADACFDVVFSSNVLEHIRDLDGMEREIARVLRPGGRAIHVLPTHHWRAWTSATHLPHLLRRVLARPPAPPTPPAPAAQPQAARNGRLQSLLGLSPHGERGHAVSEYLRYFRPSWWTRHFEAAGWDVVDHFGLELFYTGNVLVGPRLGLAARARLGRLLGTATMGFVLRRRGDP